MRALAITAAVMSAAIALGSCRNKRPEPLPGPQSAPPAGVAAQPRGTQPAATRAPAAHTASEISWFQGTLEEAFARRHCSPQQRLLQSPRLGL